MDIQADVIKLNFVKEDHRHMITLLRKAFVGAGKNVFVGAGRKFVASFRC